MATNSSDLLHLTFSPNKKSESQTEQPYANSNYTASLSYEQLKQENRSQTLVYISCCGQSDLITAFRNISVKDLSRF